MLTAQICPFGTEYKTGKTRQMTRGVSYRLCK